MSDGAAAKAAQIAGSPLVGACFRGWIRAVGPEEVHVDGQRVVRFVLRAEWESSRDLMTHLYDRAAAAVPLDPVQVPDTCAYRNTRADVLRLARDPWAEALADAAERIGVEPSTVFLVAGALLVVGPEVEGRAPTPEAAAAVEACAVALVAAMAPRIDELSTAVPAEPVPALPAPFRGMWRVPCLRRDGTGSWEPAPEVPTSPGVDVIRAHGRIPFGPATSRRLVFAFARPPGVRRSGFEWGPVLTESRFLGDDALVRHRLAVAIGTPLPLQAVETICSEDDSVLIVGSDDEGGTLDPVLAAEAARVVPAVSGAVEPPGREVLLDAASELPLRLSGRDLRLPLVEAEADTSLSGRVTPPGRRSGHVELSAIWRNRLDSGPIGRVRISRAGKLAAERGTDPAVLAAVEAGRDALAPGTAVAVVARPDLVLVTATAGRAPFRLLRPRDRPPMAVGLAPLRDILDAICGAGRAPLDVGSDEP